MRARTSVHPVLLLLVTVLWCSGPPILAQEAAGGADLDDVLEAWSRRQERMRSAVVAWDEKRLYKPGSVLPPGRAEVPGAQGLGVPIIPQRFEVPSSLRLRDGWMRYQASAARVLDGGVIDLESYVSSFDGDRSANLITPPDAPAHGIIFKDAQSPDVRAWQLTPALLFLRPLDERFGVLDRSRLRIADPDVPPAEEGLLVLTDGLNEIHVDPARDFVAVVWRFRPHQDEIGFEGRMSYRHDEQGWSLAGWKLRERDWQEGLSETVTARVTGFDPQARLTKESFAVEFPAGAVVYDQRTRTEYLVLPDGQRRVIEIHEPPKPKVDRRS